LKKDKNNDLLTLMKCIVVPQEPQKKN